mgnify:CR=1 FL=1
MTESRIQGELFQWHWNTYPNERGRFFLIHNNPKNAIDGNRLKAIGMVAGVADMCFLGSNGNVAFLELKTDKGVQSDVQKRFESQCNNCAIGYYIVRSVEEGKRIIEKYRISTCN